MYTYIAKNEREYKLCRAKIILRGGKHAIVYYFIGPHQIPRKGVTYAKDMPKGYEVKESPKSGHPLVVKSQR